MADLTDMEKELAAGLFYEIESMTSSFSENVEINVILNLLRIAVERRGINPVNILICCAQALGVPVMPIDPSNTKVH